MANRFSEVTPAILDYSDLCVKNGSIDNELYKKYDVKRGLRDISGQGVLTGLTEISKIKSYTIEDGDMIPCEGKLYYRGVDIEDIVKGFISEKRFGFEECVYLLLFGELPNEKELTDFIGVLSNYRSLPTSFVRDIIMKAPSPDMMNTLARSVLTLYSYDDNANDTSVPNAVSYTHLDVYKRQPQGGVDPLRTKPQRRQHMAFRPLRTSRTARNINAVLL